jgi:adenosylcobinamide-GDP ribazoletransferase
VAPAPPVSESPAGAGSLRVALGLFTVVPVGAPPRLGRAEAARAIHWLPVIGLLVALPAAGVLLAVEAGGHGLGRRLLAAVLAVVVMTVLTGGLHLDGLADTADGLGSRRPAAEALAIMRRSDAGPFGVLALLLVTLLQVTSIAAVPRGEVAAAALLAAAVTGRVAVVLATGPGSPAARPDGLGALVAGATGTVVRAGLAAGLLAAAAAGGAALGGAALAWRGVVAVLAGLLAADLLRRTARRSVGGLTGDVFGALIEVGATATLLALALAS